MSNYPNLRDTLELFSVQVGLEDDAARRMIRRSLESPVWRASVEIELRSLVADVNAPWIDLVANEDYEIDEPETATEAREIVLGAIWDIVFPDQAPPCAVKILE